WSADGSHDMSCYTSIPKMLWLMVLAIIMIALSWFCTTVPVLDVPFWGWVGVLFFGGGFVIMVVRLFMRGPVLVLDGLGILVRRVSPDVVLWSDIRSVSIVTYKGQRWLGVEMKDPVSFMARVPRASRWVALANQHMGFTAFNVGFAGISPGIDVVWSYLREHHADKVG